MGSLHTSNKAAPDYDAVIVGAGLSGICTLHHLRERFPTWRIKVLEAGPDVGGTWYWNRYPGCRLDSESVSYAYSFDPDLLREWHWKDKFSSQPETYRYIRYVAEKYRLYDHIQLNTRVKAARWDDDAGAWTLTDGVGMQYTARFFVSCLGFLSEPTLPDIPGVQTFFGSSFHTSDWPADLDIQKNLSGKRVGVVGTGASGIQTITALSEVPEIKSVTVFQRTANWSAPLRNEPISAREMDEIRKEYPTILERCARTSAGFLHTSDPRKSLDVSQEEREALWEKLYREAGFSKWLGVFCDTYTNRDANDLYSQFMAKKIRERLHDQTVADSLIPTHGYGMRRVPLESGYFEAYNKPNVHLVDLQKSPMARVEPQGIVLADGTKHELDVIVYATGFDAITGAFGAVDWQVKDGRPLIAPRNDQGETNDAVWLDNAPLTHLGITVPSVPNMFMILGPHQLFGNATRNIEHAVDVVIDMLEFCEKNGHTRMEVTKEAAQEWTEHVYDTSKGLLLNEVDSWMTGVNKNVKGKQTRSIARYAGSAQEFRRRCRESKVDDYSEFIFS